MALPSARRRRLTAQLKDADGSRWEAAYGPRFERQPATTPEDHAD